MAILVRLMDESNHFKHTLMPTHITFTILRHIIVGEHTALLAHTSYFAVAQHKIVNNSYMVLFV